MQQEMVLARNTSEGVWGEEWGPVESLHMCVYALCLPRAQGGQSPALSFKILLSEEWDSASSRLLMAVFMNNANCVIIQKV